MANADMCAYCFDVLVHHLEKKGDPKVPELPEEKFPLFVTWKKQQSDEKEYVLRGCIGTFTPLSLAKGLKDYALTSALRDSRFPAMKRHELPYLECTVSLLTDFEDAANHEDWTIGEHGITLEFEAMSRHYSATYLPSVAEEQGWNHNQTVDSLIRKAGYSGPISSALKRQLKVTRYRSSVYSMPHKEYAELRSIVDESEI